MSDRIIGTGVFEGYRFELCSRTDACTSCDKDTPGCYFYCENSAARHLDGNWKRIKPSAAPLTDQPTAQPTGEPTVPMCVLYKADTINRTITELSGLLESVENDGSDTDSEARISSLIRELCCPIQLAGRLGA